jgi:hypothetical protein
MKTTLKLLTLILFILATQSCKKNKDEDKPEKVTKDISNNLNISILLDLSDRISPTKFPNQTMEYYLRDVGYINSVAEAFKKHLSTKKVRQADDKIQLFFEPAPFNPEINKISNNLKIEITRNNISKEEINKIKEKYSTESLELYKLAIKDNNYVGSDTWKFFKNKIKDYCIEDNYRNILVVLTDGYIYFKDTKIQEANMTTYLTPDVIKENRLNKSNWSETMTNQKFAFIPANTDLSNLEIIVLGINPNKNNAYEEDVIKAYWTNWFETMKVKRYEIHSTELPSNMDKVIEKFINNK